MLYMRVLLVFEEKRRKIPGSARDGGEQIKLNTRGAKPQSRRSLTQKTTPEKNFARKFILN